jgi:hypothetical protein
VHICTTCQNPDVVKVREEWAEAIHTTTNDHMGQERFQIDPTKFQGLWQTCGGEMAAEQAGVGGDAVDWYDSDGEPTTGEEESRCKARELVDLLRMEEEISALPPFIISAHVETPQGKIIHKSALVALLNHCTALSNDRLTRIAEGARYGDKSAGPNAEMEGRGGCNRAVNQGIREHLRQ